MLNIYELSDDQLKEYMSGQSEEFARSLELENIVKDFEGIEKNYANLGKKFENIKTLLKNKEFDLVYDKCAELGTMIDRLSTRIRTFPFEIGEKSSNKKIKLKGDIALDKKVYFERHDDYLRVVLPEMLPRKQQYDVQSGKMKYYYDIDKWKATYYEQFAKEFEHGKYRIFTEKVSLCYIMHIAPSMAKGMGDTDNYDTKVMTDIITTFLLHDDDFLCCNYFVDIVVDEGCNDVSDSFTEIIVCPAKDREKILKEP